MTQTQHDNYHKENPHIYSRFEYYTFEAISAGRTRFGSQMILERLRWYEIVEAKNDKFKINNDMGAYYSRLFMNQYPEYKGIFNIRKSKLDTNDN